ncbi:hypothetical protein [Nocardia pseudovaccinii]|uniref:hypothetical protein n=1 Tax=Nocardia pseudovaccinii TaxID=189540 RepID=UPI0012F5008A|nr:hypothetical protein [Nocardia pseudovaccinii]
MSIAIVSNNHPDYGDPAVIVGDFTSHFCYAIPLAPIVKYLLADESIPDRA